MNHTLQAFWLGRAAYGPVLALQERLWQLARDGGPEALLLCEHDPVITLGHGALPSDLCASPEILHAESVATFAVRRGGRATYHGPGQLVAYPIVSVRRGVLAHVLALGAAACELARSQGITAAFRRDPVGVFVADRKLAAIGVQVRRRISTHGLALNVTAEACRGARAGLLVPCGEPTRALTSLAEEGGRASVEELVAPLCGALCLALGRPAAAPEATTTDSLLLALPPVK